MTAASMDTFRKAKIAELNRNKTVIPPGGQYTERDPVSGQQVTILSNELQTVTTNDTTTEKQAFDKDGKPGPKVVERKQDSTVKGYQAPGAKPPTGAKGAGTRYSNPKVDKMQDAEIVSQAEIIKAYGAAKKPLPAGMDRAEAAAIMERYEAYIKGGK